MDGLTAVAIPVARTTARAGGWRDNLRELYRYRELVASLTVRDLRVKYKRSLLGIAWSVLNPLLMVAIYTAVFSVFLRIVVLPNYWALVLCGLLAWTFFANALSTSAVAFVRSPDLVTKVRFPLEALPISMVLAHFVNFLITVALLLVLVVAVRLPLGPSIILLPLLLVAELALAVGLGLLVSTLTVYFRDIEHLLTIGLTAWFYVTPILYPLDPRALPHGAARYLPLIKLNPMSWYIGSFHSVLYYGGWPDPVLFALMLGSAVVALAGGYAVFSRLRPRLPEIV